MSDTRSCRMGSSNSSASLTRITLISSSFTSACTLRRGSSVVVGSVGSVVGVSAAGSAPASAMATEVTSGFAGSSGTSREYLEASRGSGRRWRRKLARRVASSTPRRRCREEECAVRRTAEKWSSTEQRTQRLKGAMASSTSTGRSVRLLFERQARRSVMRAATSTVCQGATATVAFSPKQSRNTGQAASSGSSTT